MNQHVNIVRLKVIAIALESLKEKIVFVGGATVSLYANRIVFEIRPTDDVDVIIEILSYAKRIALEDKLLSLEFSNDIESGIVCRYRIQGIIVDIIPTNEPSIGFSNIWYPKGFENSVDCKIDDQCTVKILSVPYFIATKIEAFKGRGANDGRTSQDFEDIVFLLENRQNIWDEINNATDELKAYLKTEFSLLFKNSFLAEWIDCHVERNSPPATNQILDNIKEFISTKTRN